MIKTLISFCLIILPGMCMSLSAQSNLGKVISLKVSAQPLDQVLEILSNRGNFYFSYNSNIIPRDSLVTIAENDKTVEQLLGMIFRSGYEFRESGNYIIIRRAPIKLTLVTNSALTDARTYTVSGFIVDEQTGMKVSYASIYEKERLSSAMTNQNGYFKLKLKSRYRKASLTVSKEFYEDTTVVIEPGANQQITITIMPMEITQHSVIISPKNYTAPDSIVLAVKYDDSMSWLYTYRKTDSVRVEKTTLGDWFISSKLKFQTINLKRFFVARPYQFSIVPGLSTNGALNSQVVNHFSFNMLGGYSGGLNGFELGGLFNINKKDARFVQIGGIFNTVGGKMQGLQVAGIHNTVLRDARAMQLAGINNFVRDSVHGLQTAGIYNHSGGKLIGAQLAGIANYAKASAAGAQLSGIANYSQGNMNGAQLAGIANINPATTNGVQIAGIVNYSRVLKGVQIGLINIADSSQGFSVGLINIVLKGYHKLALSTNDLMNVNAAFKTGTPQFYSILLGGINTDSKDQVYSFGYGLGSERNIARWLSVSPELTMQYLYLGSWDDLNLLGKANLNVNIRLSRHVSIFAGPSFNAYYSDQTAAVPDFKSEIGTGKRYKLDRDIVGWFGWNAGISIF